MVGGIYFGPIEAFPRALWGESTHLWLFYGYSLCFYCGFGYKYPSYVVGRVPMGVRNDQNKGSRVEE